MSPKVAVLANPLSLARARLECIGWMSEWWINLMPTDAEKQRRRSAELAIFSTKEALAHTT